nr:ATP-binding protein [uncultured Methanoregula sp.]
MPTGPKIAGKSPEDEDIVSDYELRYRRMAENILLGMFQITYGPDSRILSANPVMARMLGYERPEDIIGRPANDLFIRSAEFDELVADLVSQGSVAGREIRLRRKEGAEIWISVQAWKLGITPDKLIVIEGFVADVTEQRVFEQEMHYHESELNRYALALSLSNRKLNLLSSITRHDILNNLTGLRGYLDLMKEEFTDTALREYLTAQEEIIETITEQIQFTRDYQDLGVETPQWFDTNEVILMAAATLPLPPVTLTVETGDLWIYADPMLGKVFYNLLENALRHGGKLTRICFRTEVSGDSARILCEDDGTGILAQFKEAIFVRKHFKNTGFGLFLSRDILGITGLSIREKGEPGKGARFVITVPVGSFRVGHGAG